LNEKEDDCVRELNAFAKSGNYAMSILQKVYKNILNEYDIKIEDMHEILSRAGLFMDKYYTVKSFYDKEENELETCKNQTYCIEQYLQSVEKMEIN